MTSQRVVQIVGDGLKGDWMTWRWADGVHPVGVARVHGITAATGRLARALPKGADRLGFDGELSDPERERALMRSLADVLLPDELRRQLIAVADQGRPLHVRVAPTPHTGAVPWGLLFVDAERRLLDIADVSWIAPLLPRDLTDTQADPAPMRDRAPLHVIDPLQIMGQVMREADRSVLAERAPGAVFSGTRFGAEELSATLRQGVSRFVIVGHTFEGASASTTGIVLSDLVKDAPDALTAEELIADPGRWPMPPRVAVLACASASDMTDHEPFGLAAALLHNGADTVHGTLWILPTDEAYRTHGVRDRALLPMALAFENAQVADDPVAALCAWQRGRLNHWRNEPSLATSPLSWGAAMTMTAPARRSVESEDRT